MEEFIKSIYNIQIDKLWSCLKSIGEFVLSCGFVKLLYDYHTNKRNKDINYSELLREKRDELVKKYQELMIIRDKKYENCELSNNYSCHFNNKKREISNICSDINIYIRKNTNLKNKDDLINLLRSYTQFNEDEIRLNKFVKVLNESLKD